MIDCILFVNRLSSHLEGRRDDSASLLSGEENVLVENEILFAFLIEQMTQLYLRFTNEQRTERKMEIID